MMTISYINGKPADALTITDRGCMYGDGVFETLLACNASMPLWQQHWQRLQSGCERLRIPVPAEEEIRRLIEQHLRAAGQMIIKIIVTRGSGVRGYRQETTTEPNVIISITERVIKPVEYWRNGVNVYTCRTCIAEQPALAGIKHLNRLEQVLASQEWDDRYQEGLMCSLHGMVIEATSHNVFLIRNGALFTPDLTNAGVAGVMRQYVIELARDLQLPVYIQNIRLEELATMDEVFLTNSVDGVWPVRRIGDWSYACGELTRMFQEKIAELLPYQ